MNANQSKPSGETLKHYMSDLSERERRVLQHIAEGIHISRNTNDEFDKTLTVGQRLADRIATFGGSWAFILLFLGVLGAWVVLNSVILARAGRPFDPYPYILLNLLLSMLASLQAPIILMSQNRQTAKDRQDAAHDYEVNLKAELEVMALHEKLDTLREGQWQQLMALQEQQLALLAQISDRQPPESRKR